MSNNTILLKAFAIFENMGDFILPPLNVIDVLAGLKRTARLGKLTEAD